MVGSIKDFTSGNKIRKKINKTKLYQVHRVFNKTTYTYFGTRRLKSDATKNAKKLRAQGQNVRIQQIKIEGKKYYNLYTNRRK